MRTLVQQGKVVEVVIQRFRKKNNDRTILLELGLTMINICDRVWFHNNPGFVTKHSRPFDNVWSYDLYSGKFAKSGCYHYYFLDRRKAVLFKLMFPD